MASIGIFQPWLFEVSGISFGWALKA